MEIIYLNFKCNIGTRVNGGHRSSNGWVTSWTDYTKYTLTASTLDSKLPLECCSIIETFLSKYSNKSEEWTDWGVLISNEDRETILNIPELIELLNKNQKIFLFQESAIPQPYSINCLISNSKKEYQNIQYIIRSIRSELDNEIKKLKSKYNQITLERLYPHLRELITNFQIDFSILDEEIGYYPVDLIAINNDYDLLIKSIVLYSPPYKAVNEIYTVLTTGKYSYFDIIAENVPQLSAHENKVLSNYIKKLEQENGYAYIGKNSYGNKQYFSPRILPGMTNLVTLYLLKGEFEKYEKLMENPIFYQQKFGGMLKFAYLAYARWDKILLDDDDIVFFRKHLFTSEIRNKKWVPFLKLIISNEDVINHLSSLYSKIGVSNISRKEFIKRIICNTISEFDPNCK